jgi:outer membrane biosynthesis protein TonB
VDVAESSGHEILDLDAVEVLRRAFPLKFDHPLEQPEVVVQIPIIYKLQ